MPWSWAVMHQALIPVALAGLAVAGLLSPFWLVGCVAWLGHIVIGWAVGDGLRTADGYPRRGASAARHRTLATSSLESARSPA